MYKKISFLFLIIAVSFAFTSCDVSKKIKNNQVEISQLKATVRLLKESVANYERMVKKMSTEVEKLKRKNRSRRR